MVGEVFGVIQTLLLLSWCTVLLAADLHKVVDANSLEVEPCFHLGYTKNRREMEVDFGLPKALVKTFGLAEGLS